MLRCEARGNDLTFHPIPTLTLPLKGRGFQVLLDGGRDFKEHWRPSPDSSLECHATVPVLGRQFLERKSPPNPGKYVHARLWGVAPSLAGGDSCRLVFSGA